jgi:glycosyltransferase involved in cell wall biosynthesis
MSQPRRILILIDWFVPGYKAGGPIRSVLNLVRALPDFQFQVITKNHDHRDPRPYEGIEPNRWLRLEPNLEVFYYSSDFLTYGRLREQLRSLSYEHLHLNTMYSLPFTIWPLLMRLRGEIGGRPLLAPRGNLSPGSRAEKRLKKALFLGLFRLLGLQRKVCFHAASEHEADDIRAFFGAGVELRHAPNLPEQAQAPWEPLEKQPGEARFAYVARISPEKKLDFLLERFHAVPPGSRLLLDIYGPQEKADYWQRCAEIIGGLPPQAGVRYCGELAHHQLAETLSRYHFGTLTSSGENFGHSIFEALLAGKPVLISDRTPWLSLEAQEAGWDLPMEAPERFEAALRACLDMDNETYRRWSRSAWEFARRFQRDPELARQARALFDPFD